MRCSALILLLTACSVAPPPAPQLPSACAVSEAPVPGPLAEERSGTMDPLARAEVFVREARQTGDPGFYTLADQATSCALARTPSDPDALWMRAHLLVQFHDFAGAESVAAGLVETRGDWGDHMLLGDALMEQGDLGDAAAAYDRALELRGGDLRLYDRLSWLQGDLAGATSWAERAVHAASPADPEPFAWALTHLGWLHALAGAPAPEIQHALLVQPGYPPAHLARGLLRLHAGHEGADRDLRAAGPTFAALRALAELDDTVDLEAAAALDPRGHAAWLADRDPERAIALLEVELEDRQDATTKMAWAYATHLAGGEAEAVAREALATGIIEPEVLLQASVVLDDPELRARALAMGPGLLPSQRAVQP